MKDVGKANKNTGEITNKSWDHCLMKIGPLEVLNAQVSCYKVLAHSPKMMSRRA